MTSSRLIRLTKIAFRKMIFAAGVLFLLIILLAFTTLPYWMYHALGTYAEKEVETPDYIVVLGGDGMPSETNLMRCETAATLAKLFSSAKIIVALPKDSTAELTGSSLWQMRVELMLKGVDSSRIFLEPEGHNTRDQAIKIAGRMIPKNARTIIVTSPEHMYRAVKVFRKAGLEAVGSKSSFSRPLESLLTVRNGMLGGRALPADELGEEMQFRYQFWNHLKYQVLCYREYVAITYYSFKGWI